MEFHVICRYVLAVMLGESMNWLKVCPSENGNWFEHGPHHILPR
jgi:hypothetical protein